MNFSIKVFSFPASSTGGSGLNGLNSASSMIGGAVERPHWPPTRYWPLQRQHYCKCVVTDANKTEITSRDLSSSELVLFRCLKRLQIRLIDDPNITHWWQKDEFLMTEHHGSMHLNSFRKRKWRFHAFKITMNTYLHTSKTVTYLLTCFREQVESS